jgi:archaellum biogenesis ATPase FlaH
LTTQRKKLKKVLTVANIQNQSIERIQFTGEWFEAFRNPQNRGIWFVWGGSGSGKSTFLMQMAYEFAKSEKVLYNLLEEEPDDSDYVERTELCKMNEVESNFHTASYTLEQLELYMSKRNSAKVIFIDSLPYFLKKEEEYKLFKKKWAKKKIIIFSGHAKGKNPRTEFQETVMFDAKMKIYVSGYLATSKGRTFGPNGGTFIIWKEGYQKIHGLNN